MPSGWLGELGWGPGSFQDRSGRICFPPSIPRSPRGVGRGVLPGRPRAISRMQGRQSAQPGSSRASAGMKCHCSSQTDPDPGKPAGRPSWEAPSPLQAVRKHRPRRQIKRRTRAGAQTPLALSRSSCVEYTKLKIRLLGVLLSCAFLQEEVILITDLPYLLGLGLSWTCTDQRGGYQPRGAPERLALG